MTKLQMTKKTHIDLQDAAQVKIDHRRTQQTTTE
jgi:hypothetical protein